MAFSDLCHIGNAFKAVENEPDQSERIMEENSMVRDLITKILDETGPSEGTGSSPPSDKTSSSITSQFPKNTPYIPPANYNYPNNTYNFQNESNGFNFPLQNGFGNNGFVNYNDNDVTGLLGMDLEPTNDVTPEQLNLLRLAAQEIGGAQFTNQNKFDDKFYNFFETNNRNSLPDSNMFQNNFNRPNSLNLDMNFNANFDNPFMQRFPNNGFKEQNQDPSELLAFLNQMNLSSDRREDNIPIDFKIPNVELNGHYQNEEFKMQDDRNKVYFNRLHPPPKNFNNENNFYLNEMMSQNPQNFDFTNQTPVSGQNAMNYKPNGFHHNEFMQRRDMNQSMMPRDGFQPNGNEQRHFDNSGNAQQMALVRQNQELARQMSMLMRSRPPPNQLNVDVSFLHENTPFNLGLGALLGPSPVPPQVMPSPISDPTMLAPYYTMRNTRNAATSSGILHARLDACYEQWRQLERERKRTEARLALAYPGRCVSSSNSIPVPRLPPCPTRVDRLTVDMLREHTKVLTLMGKMETLRASVCLTQNKKPNNRQEDGKITVLKRGQENVANEKEKENGVDPNTFDPSTWREDVKHLADIAPHDDIEDAMLSWRGAVGAVQAARRRELAPPTPTANGTYPHPHHNGRYVRPDPILQLADAVKQLCICARRARVAMWCDLTLTVALAPHSNGAEQGDVNSASANTKVNVTENSNSAQATAKKTSENTAANQNNAAKTNNDAKEDKPTETTPTAKSDTKTTEPNNNTANNNAKTTSTTTNKPTEKQEQQKNQQRRNNNYRKINQGRNEFYKRYDARFMNHRHPYYLATGPIN